MKDTSELFLWKFKLVKEIGSARYSIKREQEILVKLGGTAKRFRPNTYYLCVGIFLILTKKGE